MARNITQSRKPKYRSPDQQIREQDARRLEIMEQANLQAIATGCDEQDMLESMLIREAVDRARGDVERALFIFDMEMEQVQRQQTCDAIDTLIKIVKDATAERTANSGYKTVAEESNYN